MEAYYTMFKYALEMFLFLGAELSILFILICAGVSLLQQYIPDSKIQAVLSGSKGRSYFLAALIGSVTPFCSCSTIPMLRGLLGAKAGFGPTMTFLFTSPLLNPIIIGLFIATFGLKITVIYVSIALVVSIISGFMLDRIGFERYVIQENKASSVTRCCEPAQKTSSCCDSSEAIAPAKFSQKISVAFQDSWKQFKQVLPYLLLGISLGSFVYGFVPNDFIAKYASGDSLFAVPVAAVIGIPLYVRVEALIPLSAALVSKGMGLGAVMALIIGGGGASLTEVILLKSMFRMPMIIAFLTVILFMAVSAGYLFQFVL